MSFEGQDRSSLSYRPEIDGLRAVAVLAVIGFHAKAPGFAGGFLGVDIFFVISGYLITGIILRQFDRGTFRVGRFYASRARRILPALLVVLIACIGLALCLPQPDQTRAFGKSAVAALFFLANIAAWKSGQGYFDQTAEEQPLVHLWSLSIEEQFYLVYPLVLTTLLRLKRHWAMPLVVIAALASFALAEWAASQAPSAAYYLLPSRSWELLAGCLLSLDDARRGRSRANMPGSGLLAWIGLSLIVASLIYVRSTDHVPGSVALPIIGGTVLILAYANRDTGAGQLLASAPFQFIGLISYSLFLWHQPALAFARLLLLNAPGPVTVSAALAAVAGISILTWRWVEQPFRDRRGFQPKTLVIGLTVPAVLIASLSFAMWSGDGLPQRFSRRTIALQGLAQKYRTRQIACYIGPGYDRTASQPCTLGDTGPVRIALVGDSHAAALAPGLDFLLNGTGVRGILFARSSCPPLLRFRAFDMAHQTGCAAARKQIFTAIMSDPRIDTVVLAARWTFYLERSFPDNGEGGRENGPNLDKPTDEDRRFLAESLKDTVRFLLARHMKVVIVYPIPEAGWDVPLYLAKANMRGMTDVDLSVSASWVARRNAASAAMLDALGSPPGLYRIRPRRKLCDRERCLVARDGAPLYFDGDHPTAATAAHILEDLWLIRSL